MYSYSNKEGQFGLYPDSSGLQTKLLKSVSYGTKLTFHNDDIRPYLKVIQFILVVPVKGAFALGKKSFHFLVSRCRGVAVWGSCGVGELQCGEVAV